MKKNSSTSLSISNLANAEFNSDSEVSADYLSKSDIKYRRDYVTDDYFTEKRKIQIKDGVVDIATGGLTAAGGTGIVLASVGADSVTFGTLSIPSTPAKAYGGIGIVVGSNKLIHGIGKFWNGLYGTEIKDVINPIRDQIPKEYKVWYDAAEVVTEVAIFQTAPYAVGINKHSNNLTNNGNYISNPSTPYDGVKKASKYLQNQNIDRIDRQRILKSFNIETLQVKQARDNQYGIRFYDINYKTKINSAYPNGQYLFETFTPYINRENLALPFSWNEMTGIKQFQIKAGTIIFTGKAAPQFQQGRHYMGGAPQIFVNQPWKYNTLLKINP